MTPEWQPPADYYPVLPTQLVQNVLSLHGPQLLLLDQDHSGAIEHTWTTWLQEQAYDDGTLATLSAITLTEPNAYLTDSFPDIQNGVVCVAPTANIKLPTGQDNSGNIREATVFEIQDAYETGDFVVPCYAKIHPSTGVSVTHMLRRQVGLGDEFIIETNGMYATVSTGIPFVFPRFFMNAHAERINFWSLYDLMKDVLQTANAHLPDESDYPLNKSGQLDALTATTITKLQRQFRMRFGEIGSDAKRIHIDSSMLRGMSNYKLAAAIEISAVSMIMGLRAWQRELMKFFEVHQTS
ncbi:MAG: hypothetical protein UT26_C0011G0002 [Microgenomates group bacterium GW2011_GWC1_39_12]|nr:MAG: hypothetical protein UT26_C0011G0002 [Microgenomates group bacterium GW2011_GWC1_39_12]